MFDASSTLTLIHLPTETIVPFECITLSQAQHSCASMLFKEILNQEHLFLLIDGCLLLVFEEFQAESLHSAIMEKNVQLALQIKLNIKKRQSSLGKENAVMISSVTVGVLVVYDFGLTIVSRVNGVQTITDTLDIIGINSKSKIKECVESTCHGLILVLHENGSITVLHSTL